MKITVTLSESEIIAILKDHFNRQGFSVYDWQIYKDSQKGVNSDLRMRSESLANLLSKEDEKYDF